jgi:hypothetical protein
MNYLIDVIDVPTFTEDGHALAAIHEAEGTGLAYNVGVDLYSGNTTYVITALTCENYAIYPPEPHTITDERFAQLWLEEVATITDWSAHYSTISNDLRARYGSGEAAQEQIKLAYERAGEKFLTENGYRKEADGRLVKLTA